MKAKFSLLIISLWVVLACIVFLMIQAQHLLEPLALEKPPQSNYDAQHKSSPTSENVKTWMHELKCSFKWILLSVTLLFLLLVALSWLVYKTLFLRMDKLVDASKKVETGDLEVRSQVMGLDELGTVGKAFDSVIRQLKETQHTLQVRKLQLDSELDIARDIQMSMIPLTFPPYPDLAEFDLFAHLTPARQVGGDFYDFYFIDKNHLCFTVGDVSGKGLPAALLMAVCRTLLKARAQDDFSPASIITHINEEISKENPNCMFVTIFLAVLNINTGRLVYTNAGHTPTLLRHQKGQVSLLEGVHGPVVGAMEGFAYEESYRDLEAGEALLLYTDGVTEAHNEKNEMYSEEKLIEFIKSHSFVSSQIVTSDLVSELKDFEGDREPFDDTTILCLKYLKSSMDPLATKTIEITNDLEEINTVISGFEAFAQEHKVPEEVLMKVHLAFDDILSNIVQYAYPEGGEHSISTTFQVYTDQVLITITDDGQPFNPLLAHTPDTDLSLEDRMVGGLGIHLVKNIMDDCRYRRKVDENILILSKKF